LEELNNEENVLTNVINLIFKPKKCKYLKACKNHNDFWGEIKNII